MGMDAIVERLGTNIQGRVVWIFQYSDGSTFNERFYICLLYTSIHMVLMSLIISGKVKKMLMFPGFLEHSVFYLDGFSVVDLVL